MLLGKSNAYFPLCQRKVSTKLHECFSMLGLTASDTEAMSNEYNAVRCSFISASERLTLKH